MWALAVWLEEKKEEEGVVPLKWINSKKRLLFWPDVDERKAMREKRVPADNWLQFKLIKIKTTSADKSVCHSYDETTTAEISGSELEAEPELGKRVVRKKTYRDCVTGSPEESDIEEEARHVDETPHTGKDSLPPPPAKIRAERSSPLPQQRGRPSAPSPPHIMTYERESTGTSAAPPQRHSWAAMSSGSPEPRDRPSVSPAPPPQHSQSSRSSSPVQPCCSSSISSLPPPTWSLISSPPAAQRSPLSAPPLQRYRSRSPHPERQPQGDDASRNQTPARPQSPTESFPMSDRKFQKKVLLLLTDIRATLRQVGSRYEEVDSDFHIEKLESMAELNSLEELITDDATKKQQMIARLAKVGGKDLGDCTSNIMKRLMTNGVMAQLNMKGRGGKVGFVSTTIYKVIRASVFRNYSDGTEANIQSAVSAYLRYAPDRAGGGGRRARSQQQ